MNNKVWVEHQPARLAIIFTQFSATISSLLIFDCRVLVKGGGWLKVKLRCRPHFLHRFRLWLDEFGNDVSHKLMPALPIMKALVTLSNGFCLIRTNTSTSLKTNMTIGKSPCSIGNSSSNGGFSIVMLVFGDVL